jgi:hypothetical protein
VFTDGGCDGMKEQDKTYWADHAFQPNPWSPHCRCVGCGVQGASGIIEWV